MSVSADEETPAVATRLIGPGERVERGAESPAPH